MLSTEKVGVLGMTHKHKHGDREACTHLLHLRRISTEKRNPPYTHTDV